MRTVLVTGASGFVGQHLRREIERQNLRSRFRFVLLSSHRVEGWEGLPDGRDEDGRYRVTRAAIAGAGLDELDAVVHLGAFTPKEGKDGFDIRRTTSNIHNTEFLLDHFAPRRRFVFTSTIDVYGPRSEPFDETMACSPISLYGASKLYCEAMLAEWARLAAPASLAVLRLGHIYGPGEERYRKLIPETIKRLRRGEAPTVMTSGRELRAFMHVEDCCRVILKALERDDSLGPVNVASAVKRPVVEIAAMLAAICEEETGRPVPPWSPSSTASAADVTLNVERMLALYGPEQVDLRDGLRDEFRSYGQPA